MSKRIATSDNARRWRHYDAGIMWTILAENEREAIELLISLSETLHRSH